MEIDSTGIAILGSAVAGTFGLMQGMVAIIKMLINKIGRNGEDKSESKEPTTQAMLEHRMEEMYKQLDRQKANKELCDQRHISIDNRLEKIDNRLEIGQGVMTRIESNQTGLETKLSGLLEAIKNGK